MLVVPAAASAATKPTDNKLPGLVTLKGSGVRTGTVSFSDPWDIYKVPLKSGQKVRVKLTGKKRGGEAYAFLLTPRSTKIDPLAAAAMTIFPTADGTPRYPQVMRFGATTNTSTQPYSLVVFGNESYTLQWEVTAADADDDVPGIERSDVATGTLNATNDWSDVYRSELTTGQALAATLTKPEGMDFQMMAFGPNLSPATIYFKTSGSQKLPCPDNAFGYSMPTGTTTEQIFFDAPKSGAYYLQAAGIAGKGEYEITSTVLDPSNLSDVTWEAPATIVASDEVTATGHLLDADGAPLAGEPVKIEGWNSAKRLWVSASDTATTAEDGAFTAVATVKRNVKLRVRYTGRFAEDAPASSETTSLAVHSVLSKPKVQRASGVARVVVTGSIDPRHTVRSRPVTLKFQRKVGSKWVTKRKVTPQVFNATGDTSKYRAVVKLPGTGYYRVIAYDTAGDHALSRSSATAFRAR